MRLALILALAVSLVACNSSRPASTVRTTITRPVSYSSPLRSMGSPVSGEVETVVVERPYQSPAYQAAGAALFSRP